MYVKNFNIVTFNNSKGISHINASYELINTIDKAIVICSLKLKSHNEAKVYDVQIFQGTYETCRKTDGRIYQYFLKNLISNFQKYGNISLACPLAKGFHFQSSQTATS